VFSAVFLAVWAGAAIVTLNAQLLGGTISFFQSVCVLGYCVFPIAIAAAVTTLLRAFVHSMVAELIVSGASGARSGQERRSGPRT
jgi:hypothetical protein